MERQDTKKLLKDTMNALSKLMQNTAHEGATWTYTLINDSKLPDFKPNEKGLAEYRLTVDKSGNMFQFITEYTKANQLPAYENAAYFAVRKLNTVIFALLAAEA